MSPKNARIYFSRLYRSSPHLIKLFRGIRRAGGIFRASPLIAVNTSGTFKLKPPVDNDNNTAQPPDRNKFPNAKEVERKLNTVGQKCRKLENSFLIGWKLKNFAVSGGFQYRLLYVYVVTLLALSMRLKTGTTCANVAKHCVLYSAYVVFALCAAHLVRCSPCALLTLGTLRFRSKANSPSAQNSLPPQKSVCRPDGRQSTRSTHEPHKSGGNRGLGPLSRRDPVSAAPARG